MPAFLNKCTRPRAVRSCARCLACLLCLALFCAALYGGWLAGLRINTTASMPKGVYRISEGRVSDGLLARGDTVEICLDGAWAQEALARGYLRPGRCESGTMPLVKTLAGLPGDEIAIEQAGDEAGIYVNGVLFPQSVIRDFDSQGRRMASSLQAGVIPKGQALLLSAHAGGFDSRYFGLADLRQLKKVEPLILF